MQAADFDVKSPSKPVTTRPATSTTTEAAATTTTSTTTTTTTTTKTTTTTEEYIPTTKYVQPELIEEEDVVEPEVSAPEDFDREPSDSEESSDSILSSNDYDENVWGEKTFDDDDSSDTINNSNVNAGEAPGSEFDSERSDYGDGEAEDIEEIEEEYADPEETEEVADPEDNEGDDTEVPEVVTIKTEYEVPVTDKIIDSEPLRTTTMDSTTTENPEVFYSDPSIIPQKNTLNSAVLPGDDDLNEGSADGAYFESDDEEENEYLSSDYDLEELKRSRRHKYKRSVTENERKYRGIHIGTKNRGKTKMKFQFGKTNLKTKWRQCTFLNLKLINYKQFTVLIDLTLRFYFMLLRRNSHQLRVVQGNQYTHLVVDQPA